MTRLPKSVTITSRRVCPIAGARRRPSEPSPRARVFEFTVDRVTVPTIPLSFGAWERGEATNVLNRARLMDGSALIRASTADEALSAYLAATGQEVYTEIRTMGDLVGHTEVVVRPSFTEVQPW